MNGNMFNGDMTCPRLPKVNLNLMSVSAPSEYFNGEGRSVGMPGLPKV